MLPAHRVFIETFAGGAALTRHKLPAELTLLIERDEQTSATLGAAMRDRRDVTVVNADALAVLKLETLPADVVVYCDPPYVMSTRKSQRDYYNHEWSDADHRRFLEWVRGAECPVVVSGYWSEMYSRRLSAWRHFAFTVGTRRGVATEHVWMNYPAPERYHDTRHVGENFTERQRIKRKGARWLEMLSSMPAADRAYILDEIERVYGSSSSRTLAPGKKGA